MAEIEEVLEMTEEAEAEIAEEAEEGALEEEEVAEIEEAKENVGKLKSALNALKEIEWGQVVKQVTKLVAENVAVGAVLWAVSTGLNKLTSKSSSSKKTANRKKQKKIKALAQLISDISTYIKDLAGWMQAKKDVTVDAGSGIMVPLPDVFTKYTQPMQQVSSITSKV